MFALAAILLLPALAKAQSTSSQTDSTAAVIRSLMNAANSDSIYAMCNPSFQKAVHANSFEDFIQRNIHLLGRISHISNRGRIGGLSWYVFEGARDTVSVLLATDASGRISGLLIRPLKKKRARSDNPLKSRLDSLVDNTIRPYMEQPGAVGVSIGIIRDGKWYTYDYGETARGNSALPDDRTIYEIGSVTKTFTASLLATFVLRGRCRLSDPVSRYLPDSLAVLKLDDSIVTLKMLANHTSGLPRVPADLAAAQPHFDDHDPYAHYSRTDLFAYLDSVRLRSVPGTRWSYSNLGFGLLGTVLEQISGEPYGRLVQQYICGPLNMEDTRLVLDKEQQRRFAAGNNIGGMPVFHWHGESMVAAGMLRSTVHDLLLYLQAHFRENARDTLSPAFRLCERPTFRTPVGGIGLAWYHTLQAGFCFHDGATAGFSSFCAYNPVRDLAIVLLSNCGAPVDATAVRLLGGLDRMP
jgi:CubicO group peptidase (beta-lactamase class C family)